MTVTYTTAQKVAAYLQRPAFSESTTPTATSVEMFINWSEGEIERKTNQAFQTLTVTNEIHTMRKIGRRYRSQYYQKPYVKLTKHNIKTMTSGTDKIEVWSGGAWTDWVATKTEGRDKDYWVDQAQGIIYFQKSFPITPYPDNVRVTYRWGESAVPTWAEELATMMAAKRVLQFDYDRTISSEGGSGDEVDLPRIDNTIASLNEEINIRLDENRWLNRKKKFVIN